MESKERLENIINCLSNNPSPRAFENCVDTLRKVAEDLDLLAVFKKHLYINKNGQIYLKGLKMNSKDYQLLKERL